MSLKRWRPDFREREILRSIFLRPGLGDFGYRKIPIGLIRIFHRINEATYKLFRVWVRSGRDTGATDESTHLNTFVKLLYKIVRELT